MLCLVVVVVIFGFWSFYFYKRHSIQTAAVSDRNFTKLSHYTHQTFSVHLKKDFNIVQFLNKAELELNEPTFKSKLHFKDDDILQNFKRQKQHVQKETWFEVRSGKQFKAIRGEP